MEGETFLCISNRAWDSLWGESQKVMSVIAKKNLVLYLEPGRSVNLPILSEAKRSLPNLFSFHAEKKLENIIIISGPPSLPLGRRHLPNKVLEKTVPLACSLNNQMIVRTGRKALDFFNISNPVLWLYSPYHSGLVGKFGEKISCYHNYDEFADFITNARIKDIVQKYDNLLSSSVDVVFATSRAQWQRRSRVNPNTYFVPNGVDFDLFHRALDPSLPKPDELSKIPRPIIGFAGTLYNHIDVDLLVHIARTYPKCSLVLVGPDTLPSSRESSLLHRLPNVHFLGSKALQRLPDYIRTFDVALIPYRLEGHVLSGYPQKLLEYLSAGKAVVTTAMPELEPYRQVVRIGATHDEFVHLISEALLGSTPEEIDARLSIASANTWDQRVNEYYRILNELLSTDVSVRKDRNNTTNVL